MCPGRGTNALFVGVSILTAGQRYYFKIKYATILSKIFLKNFIGILVFYCVDDVKYLYLGSFRPFVARIIFHMAKRPIIAILITIGCF